MTTSLYQNIQASLRMYFRTLYSSGVWYIDSKNENMTEAVFVELQTSLGRKQDDRKAYQYDFAQLLVHSQDVATLDFVIGTLTAGLDGAGVIPVKDYINEKPNDKLGELQITRYELSPLMSVSNYALRAITVYYECIE